MSFSNVLDRLRDAAKHVPDNYRQRGMGTSRIVEVKDLAELLRHFDRLDAEARMGYPLHIKELADAATKAVAELQDGDTKKHLEFALHLVRPNSGVRI